MIRVKRIGHIKVDHQEAARALGAAIMRHMRKRFERRLDAHDLAFPGHSPLYRRQLQAIGDDDSADVKESGGLLRAIRLLRVERRGGRQVLVFGVDSGTSPRRPRPPPWVFAGTPDENARALERWRRAPKKAARSLPYPELLALQQRGNGRSPPRQVLGVSPRGRGPVVRAIEKARIFRS